MLSSDQARFNLEDAKIDLDRMERLYERGAISKDQLEGAQLRYSTAKKQYEASLSIVKQAEESLRLARANTATRSISRDVGRLSIRSSSRAWVSPSIQCRSSKTNSSG